MKNRSGLALYIIGCFVSVGLILSGYFVGQGLEKFRRPQKAISVKGIGEKEVYADHAFWRISFAATGSNFGEAKQAYDANIRAILKFLKNHNFQISEIQVRAPNVERNLQEVSTSQSADFKKEEWYNILGTVIINTDQVKKVENASQYTFQLLQEDVWLRETDEYRANPQYIITNFDALRADIFRSAIESSYKMAVQITKNSSAKIGKIRFVDQGSFSIRSVFGHENEEAYPKKKVRVVSFVTYNLK